MKATTGMPMKKVSTAARTRLPMTFLAMNPSAQMMERLQAEAEEATGGQRRFLCVFSLGVCLCVSLSLSPRARLVLYENG